MTREKKLAVVILTLNEERNLPDCLRSIASLNCEIYVVDSGSTDRTVEMAGARGASVVTHAFDGYGKQRNWALANLPFSCEWVLNLDADERLTPELAREIDQMLANPPIGTEGFRLRRRTVFMGRWIRHGAHYPNYQLRLFRRSSGVCEDRLYDQHFVVRGAVSSMKYDYIDIVASRLSTWSTRHIRWAEAEADELLRKAVEGPRVSASLSGGPIGRRRWLREKIYAQAPIFARPLAYWIYRYFIRLGFLDGREGLVFHFLQGFWYRFLVDAVLYERRQSVATRPSDPVPANFAEKAHE